MTPHLAAAAYGACLPKPGEAGVVHTVFRRACNLCFGDRLLVLLAPDLPLVSWGVRLSALPRPFTELAAAGMPCHLEAGALLVGDRLAVDLQPARLWTGDRLVPKVTGSAAASGQAQAAAWCSLRIIAAKRGWPGLCVLLAPAGQRVTRPASRLDAVLFAVAGEAVSTLQKARRENDTAAAVRAARHLAGLGPGLTPAGDDFLGGYLAGLFIQTPPARGTFAQAFARGLATALPPGQPDVGHMFLTQACRGSFSEHLAALAAAMSTGTAARVRLEYYASQMLSFGATSGADTLAGLLAAGPPAATTGADGRRPGT